MKWRLILAMTGVVAMVLLAHDIPLADHLRKVEQERLLAGLERDAFMLAGLAENLLSGEPTTATIEDLQASIDEYAARDGASVVITDDIGALFVSTNDAHTRGDDFSTRPEIDTALTGTPATGERSSDTLGEPLVYAAVPVVSGSDVFGTVRITFRASVIDERTSKRSRGLIEVFFVSLFVAMGAAVLVASTISRPIERLRRRTEELASGDFGGRADSAKGPPEVRSLARSFNAMTERVASLMAKQRAFAGDASHQLRTPLTALRLQLERASAMVESDPVGARERIEAATNETERLQRLVEGLLMMARADGTDPELLSVDVSAVTSERADVWESLCDERNITLVRQIDDGLTARAVAHAVEQIIDNYIDNALGVAPEGSTLTLIARRGHDDELGDVVEVHVVDQGPGIAPEDLERAFDRFWRAPDARQGGSGIGLSVVHHLAERSGGRVTLRNANPGLDAQLTLPVWSLAHAQHA